VTSVEKLVQRQRWKKSFGELFKEGLTDISLISWQVWQADTWRKKKNKK
jgi:hypothetical protein